VIVCNRPCDRGDRPPTMPRVFQAGFDDVHHERAFECPARNNCRLPPPNRGQMDGKLRAFDLPMIRSFIPGQPDARVWNDCPGRAGPIRCGPDYHPTICPSLRCAAAVQQRSSFESFKLSPALQSLSSPRPGIQPPNTRARCSPLSAVQALVFTHTTPRRWPSVVGSRALSDVRLKGVAQMRALQTP